MAESSLSAVFDWLALEAAGLGSQSAVLTVLGERLVDAGLPMSRIAAHLRTLNPLVAGSTFEWQRATGRAVERMQLIGIEQVLGALQADPAGGDDEDALVARVEAGGTALRSRLPGGGDRLVAAVRFSDGTRHAAVWDGDPPGFEAAHIPWLEELSARLAGPLEILTARQTAETLLGTYLGKRSGARVLDGEIRRGSGETIRAVLWMSDLRGFTGLSETLPRDDLIQLLNAHFERLAAPIKAFGGEVLKFIGDGLLAVFPLDDFGAARACLKALNAVHAARAAMAVFNAERQQAGRPALEFGIALHLGDVMYGNIGAPDRLDFTVIGPAVNVASRIEAECKRLGRSVLVSSEFAAACSVPLVRVDTVALRGVGQLADLFAPDEGESRT